jgi:RimJ/RimL family protein N-acetyltransferase
MAIILRDVLPSDLPIFFEQQLDADANHMAAFIADKPSDRAAFDSHWKHILSDKTGIMQTIIYDGEVAGYVGKFVWFGEPDVCYWLGKKYWGKGIATAALTQLLQNYTARPLFARAAGDNIGSVRVLEKCGFKHIGTAISFANGRGGNIQEVILKLDE